MKKRPQVLVAIGTRPEAIKLAPLVLALRKTASLETRVVVTAQHRRMLDQALRVFDIHPDADLDIMQERQTLGEVTARAILGMQRVFEADPPDLVVVQGDTATVLSVALCAFYFRIPVAHVEAGLRTYDYAAPFPEEMNRRLVTRLASWHFAPTAEAREHLLRDGIDDARIVVTGNTGVDALLTIAARPHVMAHPALSKLDFDRHRIILATLHRRENWGEPARQVCRAIRTILRQFTNVTVVFSVHGNPAVRDVIHAEIEGLDRLVLLDSLDYETFVHLMSKSYLIMTDSGGIQEEAPSLRKPVLVLRDKTERPEGIATGALELVGAHEERIVSSAGRLLNDRNAYERMSGGHNPYGDGTAATQIAAHLSRLLAAGPLPPHPLPPHPVGPTQTLRSVATDGRQ